MLLGLGMLLAPASLLVAEAAVYELRPASGSRFALMIQKTGLLSGKTHVFLFERYQGTLVYDPAFPENSRVELAIDAASAVCQDTWVSENDRKKIQDYALHDMLAVEQYRQIHFTSTGAVRTGEKSFDVPGMLTIRGLAVPVTVSVAVETHPDGLASVAGQAVVRMKDYALKPPRAAFGTIGTRNEMTVEFLLLPAAGMELTQAEKRP
jgi:polyisoprenoid-binding protein YceI